MSCAWNRRRASDLAALALVCAVAGPAAGVEVRLAPGADAGGALRAQLAEDATWLAQQPAGRLAAPAEGPPDTLLAWLRRRTPARGGIAEVAAGTRDVLSLLRDRWQARGHLTATVALVDSAVVVDPGPAYRVGELTVAGADFPGRARLLETLLPRRGDRFDAAALEEAVALLLRAVGERGYPFPAWEVRSIAVRPDAGEVDVAAGLYPGSPAVVGPQRATVPRARGEEFVVRTAGVPSGARFRESDLVRGRDRLLARGLYDEVRAPELYVVGGADTVGITWRVTERPRANRLAVVLGLSRRGEQGGSRLSGSVDLRLPNIAGRGRALAVAWSDDGAQRSRFGFSYLEPLALGTPLDAQASLASEVQRDSYTRLQFDGVARLPVVSLWWVEAGAGWDRTTFPAGEAERSSRRRLRAAIGRRRGDLAASGWQALFALETAWRATSPRDSLAAATLGRDVRQRLLETDLAGELWLSPTLAMAARASLRQVDAGDAAVPLSEQYRFGGATTLRGYREDEFHGETAAWGGVEARLGRARRSRVYTFVDTGYFEFAGDEGRATGFGLGLMARSGLGEIDLAVGFPGSVEFTTAKLHVSLLGTF